MNTRDLATAARREALVVGIANSIRSRPAARAFRELGADLALTYSTTRRSRMSSPGKRPGSGAAAAAGRGAPGELEAVFERVASQWGRLDILVHSIAWAPKADLEGGLLDCSAEGFAKAMDITCHSFVRMARLAAPLMSEGGTMFAMTFHGAQKVVANYNMMGPVKAALEATCRYLAAELGPRRIRVHAISPGPLKTRASSGLKDFDQLIDQAAQRAPVGELVDVMDVGYACGWLATPYARRVTGDTVYVDGGLHIMA
jgi:enoyl-[acyl-carrier protein] reductase I